MMKTHVEKAPEIETQTLANELASQELFTGLKVPIRFVFQRHPKSISMTAF
jgi:hypothetical protein